MDKIPTLLDISPTNLSDLDERDAYQHFFGKSLTEAQDLFDQSDFYVNDLRWMGVNAFEYYVDAYIRHLKNCDLSELDIAVPMSVVMMRHSMFENRAGLEKLLQAISDLRIKSMQSDVEFEGKYDEIAEKYR